jgi:adenylate kinase family enzyme
VKRIAIVCPGGSGKSVLAQRLGTLLDLDVVHLDSALWRPGWVRVSPQEQRAIVTDAVMRPKWIIDGDHIRTQETRFQAADTIIFLDFGRCVCLRRVVAPFVRHRGSNRMGVAESCPERLNWALLKWTWRYPNDNIEQFSTGRKVIVLRSPRDVDKLIAEISISIKRSWHLWYNNVGSLSDMRLEPVLMTVGYEGTTSKLFFELLRQNNVEALIDVRELPLSRKPGFSKSALERRAQEEGVRYVHMVALGCPRAVRHEYRDDHDWDHYKSAYEAYLATQSRAVGDLTELAQRQRCCLMCFEANPHLCHRSIVADRVQTSVTGGLVVVHLSRKVPVQAGRSALAAV